MGFTASAIFQQAMINPLLQACWTTAKPTTYGSLSADTINVALFGNSGTPNKADTLANTAYAAGQWITGNETNGGANWPAGGWRWRRRRSRLTPGRRASASRARRWRAPGT